MGKEEKRETPLGIRKLPGLLDTSHLGLFISGLCIKADRSIKSQFDSVSPEEDQGQQDLVGPVRAGLGGQGTVAKGLVGPVRTGLGGQGAVTKESSRSSQGWPGWAGHCGQGVW